VAGCCEYGDEPSDYGATELVSLSKTSEYRKSFKCIPNKSCVQVPPDVKQELHSARHNETFDDMSLHISACAESILSASFHILRVSLL
jgi:hypothetical protein